MKDVRMSSKKRNKKIILLVLIVSFVVLIDQLTKAYILNFRDSFLYGQKVFNGLNIVYVENKGISFGFLADLNISFYLGIISFFIGFYIIFLIEKSNQFQELLSLSMIFGGAVGNGFDRVINNYVIDFIDFYYNNYHWPAFNFADAFITLGAVIYFWRIIVKN